MEKKLIFIDPGHSDRDPGAVGYETEFQLAEAVSRHQAEYLRANYDCEVFICPSNVDSLAEICDMANGMGAALYVSNHFNAGGGDGYEALVYSKARVELGKIFAKHVQATGQNLRSSAVAPGVKIRTDLSVLKRTKMPAIINEGAFVDNKKDIADWNEETELQKLGEAYARATAEYLKLEEKAETPEAYTQDQFVREVQEALGTTVDGWAGPVTLGATVTLSAKKNREHPAVRPVQKRLAALGYTVVGEADGIAGAKFEAAVIAFQEDNQCWVDGEITKGNKTWKKLLGME